MNKHRISAKHVPQIRDWLANRGGIAIWRSINLGNLGASWTTPLRTKDLVYLTTKPNWQADSKPVRVITDPSEIEVMVPVEVKRFHVATRIGDQGLSVKVTDGGTRRIRSEVAKAQEKYADAWYEFDYLDYKNAVIMAASEIVPLEEYKIDKH